MTLRTDPATKPAVLRWFCPNCLAEHTDAMPLDEALEGARQLLMEGVAYCVVYDAVEYELMNADRLEEAYELTPSATLNVTLSKRLFKTLFNRSKSL
jgi:hypothetical protein